MFDAVRENPKIVRIFLALITIPFAIWGVESYMRYDGAGGALATVGDTKVTAQDFQLAMREQQDQLRNTLGPSFDPSMLEAPEARAAVLDQLVTQKLLAEYARKAKLSISEEQLRSFIGSQELLQDNGQFSPRKYQEFLRAQNKSDTQFEFQLRQDMAVQQIGAAVAGGLIVSRAAGERWLAAQLEKREVAEIVLQPEAYLDKVKLEADAVQKFYDANLKAFEVPEQVKVEYLVLSLDALTEQEPVGDAQIKAWYEGHLDRYKQAEERRASHILIPVAKDAKDDAVAQAKAKADDLLRQIKARPDSFAELAKQHSQDPGSAGNGGDLGFFGRGMMVKPFEDTAFALKEGQVSEVIRSDFGFHIIKVTGVKAERGRTLDEARGEIELELKHQGAQKKFGEIAEQFSNLVYEQSDSLKPAAEKFKLQPRQSDWIVKGSPQVPAELANPKLVKALFSDDALKNKRNTEAVEVSSGTLVSARVLEHRPAQTRPLAEVSAQIEQRLKREQAGKLAAEAGQALLAKLQKGEPADAGWSAPKLIGRNGQPGMSPQGVKAAFHASGAKLPAYAGGAIPNGGYALYKVVSVKPAEINKTDPVQNNLRQQYVQLAQGVDFGAFLSGVRARSGVEINQKALESKPQ